MPYWRATKIGIIPILPFNLANALPITAPNESAGLVAFIAWPIVEDVVSRSPISMENSRASTLQYVLPVRAIGNLLLFEGLLPRIMPG